MKTAHVLLPLLVLSLFATRAFAYQEDSTETLMNSFNSTADAISFPGMTSEDTQDDTAASNAEAEHKARREKEKKEEEAQRQKQKELCAKYVCKADIMRQTATEAIEYIAGNPAGPYLSSFFNAVHDSGYSQDELIEFVFYTASELDNPKAKK